MRHVLFLLCFFPHVCDDLVALVEVSQAPEDLEGALANGLRHRLLWA